MWYIHPDYYYAECNANCTNAASWTPVKVPVAAKYYIDPQSARYFSLDSQGRPRFVCSGENDDYEHTYASFTYTTCDGNCTIASNWHSYFIDLGQNMYVYQPQIVLNANNQPRIMTILDVNDVYKLVYLKCDANCSQGGSWTYNVLYEVGQDGEFSFRLDSQGWPRVAYYKESISDPMLYYAWSTTAAANPASWVITHLNLPPNDWRTVDLAIDSKDRPRMAFASADQNLEYVECTANCGDPTGAVWQVQDIETVDALNAIDPISPGTCSSSTWMVEGFPSLALDGADRPSVSYFVRHYKACPATTHDVWGLRFATAGTGPEPKPLDKRVFLPAIVR
jgi:hypothetical protein